MKTFALVLLITVGLVACDSAAKSTPTAVPPDPTEQAQAILKTCYDSNVTHMHAIDGSWSASEESRFDRRLVIENGAGVQAVCEEQGYDWDDSYMSGYIDPWVYEEFGILP